MQALVAFIAGAVAKIYDDGVDAGYITDDYQKKILETLHCFLFGGLSINNFTFSLINLIMNICNHLGNEEAYREPYEWSLLAVYPIFLILSFTTREYLSIYDLILFVTLSVALYIEPIFITEEISIRKLAVRSISLGVQITSLYIFAPYLNTGAYLSFLYFFGYIFISTLFQSYSLSSSSTKEHIHNFLRTFQDGISALRVDLGSVLSFSLSPSLNVTAA